jgi:hypothetical protein
MTPPAPDLSWVRAAIGFWTQQLELPPEERQTKDVDATILHTLRELERLSEADEN